MLRSRDFTPFPLNFSRFRLPFGAKSGANFGDTPNATEGYGPATATEDPSNVRQREKNTRNVA